MYPMTVPQVPRLCQDGIDIATCTMVVSLSIGLLHVSRVSRSWRAGIYIARALNLPVLRSQEPGGGRRVEIRIVKVCFGHLGLGTRVVISCIDKLAELLLELLDSFSELLRRAAGIGRCGSEKRDARYSVTLRVSSVDTICKPFGALSRFNALIRDIRTRSRSSGADAVLTRQFAIAPNFAAPASDASQGRPSSTLLRRRILHFGIFSRCTGGPRASLVEYGEYVREMQEKERCRFAKWRHQNKPAIMSEGEALDFGLRCFRGNHRGCFRGEFPKTAPGRI